MFITASSGFVSSVGHKKIISVTQRHKCTYTLSAAGWHAHGKWNMQAG